MQSPELHVKWLNTLSFLENCGARKIAACEHPTRVKEEILKHAAEEFRHAHYLKRQIGRVSAASPLDYTLPHLLGGIATLHYLKKLDIATSRFLYKKVKLPKGMAKEAAYLLVTYAIELRAAELYPLYSTILRNSGSKVTVSSILLEEKEHLAEMREALQIFPNGLEYADAVSQFESHLCNNWLQAIAQDVRN